MFLGAISLQSPLVTAPYAATALSCGRMHLICIDNSQEATGMPALRAQKLFLSNLGGLGDALETLSCSVACQ